MVCITSLPLSQPHLPTSSTNMVLTQPCKCHKLFKFLFSKSFLMRDRWLMSLAPKWLYENHLFITKFINGDWGTPSPKTPPWTTPWLIPPPPLPTEFTNGGLRPCWIRIMNNVWDWSFQYSKLYIKYYLMVPRNRKCEILNGFFFRVKGFGTWAASWELLLWIETAGTLN